MAIVQPNCFSSDVATIGDIPCVVENIIRPLPSIIALAAVAMVIMAGIRIITAGPDAKALASAWSTFSWAVIGLVLLLGAWLVLVLIKNFTGADVTTFGI